MSENNKIEWQDMTTTENMEGMQEVVKAITQLQEIAQRNYKQINYLRTKKGGRKTRRKKRNKRKRKTRKRKRYKK